MASHRIEHDLIGDREIDDRFYFGIHTARAVDNFPITGVRLAHFPDLVRSLAMVKLAAALANRDLGALDETRAKAIELACRKIIAGERHDQFVVDMIQGGAGTSTNMNANEVIANLALEELGHRRGDYGHLHPNDHVNLSQSTNDAYPTAIRLAVIFKSRTLIAEQKRLGEAFLAKSREFAPIVKVGRTQLQDAVPITLGHEFASFASTIAEDIGRLEELSRILKTVNLGGTAVGTGINAPKGYAEKAVRHLSEISGLDLVGAADLVDASSDMGAFVSFSGLLRRVAVKISKISSDLRLLGSGPRAGFGEITLPPVQAGSSIMPGKINPVIPEVVNQVAYQVVGNDITITMAAENGQLQLNAMEPVIAFNLLESIRILANAMGVLTDRCVVGIGADEKRCERLLRGSLVLATALVPKLGYEKAAKVAREAHESGRTICDVVLEARLMTAKEFAAAVDLDSLLG